MNTINKITNLFGASVAVVDVVDVFVVKRDVVTLDAVVVVVAARAEVVDFAVVVLETGRLAAETVVVDLTSPFTGFLAAASDDNGFFSIAFTGG